MLAQVRSTSLTPKLQLGDGCEDRANDPATCEREHDHGALHHPRPGRSAGRDGEIWKGFGPQTDLIEDLKGRRGVDKAAYPIPVESPIRRSLMFPNSSA